MYLLVRVRMKTMTFTFKHPELGHEYHWRMCGNYMAVLCDVCMQVVRKAIVSKEGYIER